jgi:hypothetical protein
MKGGSQIDLVLLLDSENLANLFRRRTAWHSRDTSSFSKATSAFLVTGSGAGDKDPPPVTFAAT